MRFFFDSGVCEKRFLFYSVVLMCSPPLPRVFNVEDDGGAGAPAQKGNLFSLAANHPSLHTTNIEEKGEGL